MPAESSVDQNAILPYLGDESSAFAGHAERVFFPTDALQVAEVLTRASEDGAAVTVSGGGTSITGARVPTAGGWVLATDRICSVAEPGGERGITPPATWNRVATSDGCFYLDAGRMRAVVPAGLRLSELDALIEPYGLFYPPTLTEMSAMAGGTIATNASGARSFHYGSTRAWVDALTVVTAAGRRLDLRRGQCLARDRSISLAPDLPEFRLPELPDYRSIKNAAGYYTGPDVDAVDLFVGGEGTLGVITQAEISLAPRAGNAVTLIFFFRKRDAALDYADSLRDGALDPWTVLAIEYFDGNSLDFMREAYGETPGAAAAVLVEVASLPESGKEAGEAPQWFDHEEEVHRWLSHASGFDTVASWAVLPTESEDIRLFRHSLPDRVNDFVRSRHGKLGTDFGVPGDQFRALMEAYDEAQSSGIRTVLFGHLGEFHLHLNFLAESAKQMERAREIYGSLAKRTVELGGTVSAEHGVGKKRVSVGGHAPVPYLEVMYGETGMALARELKKQFDPAWILNRDTMLPWGAERA